ncbi:hypothetical protein DB346_23515 [Verrucomicrobia bacterium LW23]|nr:hypothetical protein DB346_23515 [Verrucomicrobia bacterium LW23]
MALIRLNYRAFFVQAIAALLLAGCLAGCATSDRPKVPTQNDLLGKDAPGLKTETLTMEEFRSETQIPNSGTRRCVVRGRRGSYFYADIYESGLPNAEMERTRIIRTREIQTGGLAPGGDSNRDAPVELQFQQIPIPRSNAPSNISHGGQAVY